MPVGLSAPRQGFFFSFSSCLSSLSMQEMLKVFIPPSTRERQARAIERASVTSGEPVTRSLATRCSVGWWVCDGGRLACVVWSQSSQPAVKYPASSVGGGQVGGVEAGWRRASSTAATRDYAESPRDLIPSPSPLPANGAKMQNTVITPSDDDPQYVLWMTVQFVYSRFLLK